MTAPVTWSPSAEAALKRLEDKLFATTTEAALIIRCDARTLRKAIDAGEVPAVRTGNTYRVPTAWLRKQVALGLSGGEDNGPAA